MLCWEVDHEASGRIEGSRVYLFKQIGRLGLCFLEPGGYSWTIRGLMTIIYSIEKLNPLNRKPARILCMSLSLRGFVRVIYLQSGTFTGSGAGLPNPAFFWIWSGSFSKSLEMWILKALHSLWLAFL